MANNFKNSFVSVTTAGENYQSSASDSLTGPQTVYTANNGSGVNSILIELDAANTGDTAITATAFVQDTSATLGTITSISSTSDTATVTCAGSHGLATGMYVNVTGSSTNYVNGIYKITKTGATTFTYAQNSSASNGTAAGTITIFKAFHIVKDAPIPPQSTLKIVSGQKVVLNSDDKVLVYGSAASLDVVASILEDVT